MLHNGLTLPLNYPFPWGTWTPIQYMVPWPPPKSTSQMASRSVQPFSQGSWSRQTDKPYYSICNNIYVPLWCSLIMVTIIFYKHNERRVRDAGRVDCHVEWTHTRALSGDISKTHLSLESISWEGSASFHYAYTTHHHAVTALQPYHHEFIEKLTEHSTLHYCTH